MNKKTTAYIWGICGLVLLTMPLWSFLFSSGFDLRLMVISPIAGIGFISRYASLMREYRSEVHEHDNEH